MRWLVGILVTAVLGLAVAALTWPQLFRLERTFPLAQAVAFRGVVAAALCAVLVLALLLALVRRLRPVAMAAAAVVLVGGIANAAVLATRGIGDDNLPTPTAGSIRVMTWNTAGEAAPAELIAQTAVAMGADVVTLPETTQKAGTQVAVDMRRLGRPMWVLNAKYPGWDANSTSVLISPRLGDYSVIRSSLDGSSNTSTVPSAVAMPVNGRGPIIVAVHAVAPRASYMQRWSADLRWLADQCANDDVIMAGDFNATLDHMTGLGTLGGTLGRCTDAAAATGNAAVGTWPTSAPALLGSPIDHVMAGGHWRATGSIVLQSLDRSGSDHRPLIVQLEPVR